MSLSFCPDCKLVQLNQTPDPAELFSDYVWVTGTSSTAGSYARKFCDMVLEHTDVNNNGYILELASNDGTFLKPFIEKGQNVLGIDPARNIVQKALSENIPTTCGFFGNDLAEDTVTSKGKPKVVFARNVLPHVANLHDFVEGIHHCTDENTIVVIEVHYAKIILDQLHYDSIYHEHLCYFSFLSLQSLLNSHNLYVFDIKKSPISGGSIVLFIKNQPAPQLPSVKQFTDTESAEKTNELSNWQNFAKNSFSHKEKLLKLLDDQLSKSRSVVGYGASARSSTLLNFCRIDSKYLSSIADQNPLKQNKFTAGSRIMIQDPEIVMQKTPDTVLLLAWNFADEITAVLKDRFNFKGDIIIPLPNEPKVINLGD